MHKKGGNTIKFDDDKSGRKYKDPIIERIDVKIPYINYKYYGLEIVLMSHYSLYIYDFKLCGKNKHNPRNISILQETQLTIRKSTLLRSIS